MVARPVIRPRDTTIPSGPAGVLFAVLPSAVEGSGICSMQTFYLARQAGLLLARADCNQAAKPARTYREEESSPLKRTISTKDTVVLFARFLCIWKPNSVRVRRLRPMRYRTSAGHPDQHVRGRRRYDSAGSARCARCTQNLLCGAHRRVQRSGLPARRAGCRALLRLVARASPAARERRPGQDAAAAFGRGARLRHEPV